MQKRTFQDRIVKSKKQLDEVRTVKYDDDEELLTVNRDDIFDKRSFKTDEVDEIDYNELKDTAGVKVIRYDEDIRKVYCSRNTSPFGYIAIIASTKLSIYLAYADEINAMYDLAWTLTQWDLREFDSGARVEIIEFSDSCESIFTYSNTGELSIWSLKKKQF